MYISLFDRLSGTYNTTSPIQNILFRLVYFNKLAFWSIVQLLVLFGLTFPAWADVNQMMGSYRQQVPIDVPNFRGIEPNVSLVYDSNSGHGMAGVGWSLQPLSYIERRSTDGGTANYNSADVYYFDGQALLPYTGLGGTHAMKKQSYQRITLSNNVWTVFNRNGVKLTYDQRLDNERGTYRWYLSEVEDTSNNKVYYTYWNNGGVEVYPSTISYNNNDIEFVWETRADTATYARGNSSLGQTDRRLALIKVSVSQQLKAAYKLSYQNNSATTANGASKLVSFQHYGSDAYISGSNILSGTAYPARTFSYSSSNDSLVMSRWATNQGGYWDDQNWTSGDFNGDGKTDLAKFWNDGGSMTADVHLSNGNGFDIQRFATKQGGYWNEQHWLTGDFNGDGKVDLAKFWNDAGSVTIDAHLSNGSSFTSQRFATRQGGYSSTQRWLAGDFNGDNKTDLAKYWNDGGYFTVDVHISNGSSFTMQRWATRQGGYSDLQQWVTGDFNGDGKLDLAKHFSEGGNMSADVHISNGSGFTMQRWATGQGGYFTSQQWITGDFNGDGQTDLAKHWSDGGLMSADVHLSTGNGFVSSRWATKKGAYLSTQKWLAGDYNGDGKTDLSNTFNGGGLMVTDVHVSTGDDFAFKRWATSQGGFSTSQNWIVGDFNGDGKTDLAKYWGSGGQVNADVHVSSGGFADIMISRTNESGGTESISYLSSTTWSGQNFPQGIQWPMVSAVTVSDGRGNSATNNYQYAEAKLDFTTGNVLGFGEVTVTDNTTGAYSKTEFMQTVASVGSVEKLTIYKADGKRYSQQVNQYQEAGNGTTAPYTSLLINKWQHKYELSSTPITAHQYYVYTSDSHQNISQIHNYGDTSTSDDDFKTYFSYAVNNTDFIVDLPSIISMYSPTWQVLSRSYMYYDNATSYWTVPSKGLLTKTLSWNDYTNSYITITSSYDSYGNAISVTDGNNATTTTSYDSTYHIYPVSKTNALGHVNSTQWNYRLGVPSTTTDENNQTTSYQYDALGRVTSITLPGLGTMTSQYVSLGNPSLQHVRETRADGVVTQTYLDGLSRQWLIKETATNGAVRNVQNVYQGKGVDPIKVSLPYVTSPSYITTDYDDLKRPIKVTQVDGTSRSTEYYRDYTRVVDATNHKKDSYHNAIGQLTQVVEYNGFTPYYTDYSYDRIGNLTQVTDHLGNQTLLTWDSLGRRLSLDTPSAGLTTFEYDNVGNITAQTDVLGQTIDYSYDAINRLTAKIYPDNTSVDYQYDDNSISNGIGRLARTDYPVGSQVIGGYHASGQVTSKTTQVDSHAYTMSSSFDLYGRVSAISYPNETIAYGYDNFGRLASASNYVSSISYDNRDQITAMSYTNGVTNYFNYDNAKPLMTSQSAYKGGTLVFDANYGYDNAGIVTSHRSSTNPLMQANFYYDGLYRLTSVSGYGQTTTNQTLQYDALGNVTYNSRNGGNYSYTATGPHAVSYANGSNYHYDAKGNMTSGGGRTIGWDYEGRVTSVTKAGVIQTYAYDDQGIRIKKFDGNNVTYYFGQELEFDTATNKLTMYVFVGDKRIARKVNTVKSFYHSDNVGNTRVLTDVNGNVIDRYDYSGFGEQVGSGTSTAHQFGSHDFDQATGLIYMNARYYDPKLGRFISADTMVQGIAGQGLNPYTYVLNSPVNGNDPSGHFGDFSFGTIDFSFGSFDITSFDVPLLFDLGISDLGSNFSISDTVSFDTSNDFSNSFIDQLDLGNLALGDNDFGNASSSNFNAASSGSSNPFVVNGNKGSIGKNTAKSKSKAEGADYVQVKPGVFEVKVTGLDSDHWVEIPGIPGKIRIELAEGLEVGDYVKLFVGTIYKASVGNVGVLNGSVSMGRGEVLEMPIFEASIAISKLESAYTFEGSNIINTVLQFLPASIGGMFGGSEKHGAVFTPVLIPFSGKISYWQKIPGGVTTTHTVHETLGYSRESKGVLQNVQVEIYK